jgi:hypothetical protein
MWNGDYHFNINTQMNYWLTMPCNLIEMNEPMINFIDSLVEPGTKTAEAYYNTRGWIAHRLTNVWGYTSPAGMDIGGAAWLCEHLWEQYAFTMDKDFLKKVYPIMKSSCEFYIDNLYSTRSPETNGSSPAPPPHQKQASYYLTEKVKVASVLARPLISSNSVNSSAIPSKPQKFSAWMKTFANNLLRCVPVSPRTKSTPKAASRNGSNPTKPASPATATSLHSTASIPITKSHQRRLLKWLRLHKLC